ncbi:uncharacterized protein L201_006729 [Kwoniella dendrophila CBS 6074]|uniref:Protein SYM1 n=1 Tax=Kwoniella dendrophila CBS 6074 TaxID=1295534 RepID=A0AAX4K4L1_9TREE
MAAIPRPGLFSRIWLSYTTALRQKPLRTKMIQSGVLYISADLVAQFGIEGKSIISRPNDGREEEQEMYDPIRTARLSIYGSTIFAPLAHYWLNSIERIALGSKFKTIAARLALDICLWSPFVTFMFPTCLGLLEGKRIDEVRKKVAHGWFPTWQKAVMVFGPTQIINFSLIPQQHRLLTVQSVGLCWNIFLSWQNNRNNKLLSNAEILLEQAKSDSLKLNKQFNQQQQHLSIHGEQVSEEDVEESKKDLEEAQSKVDKAKNKKESLKKQGGEDGVGVKMAWS